jgi:hypothetical protein
MENDVSRIVKGLPEFTCTKCGCTKEISHFHKNTGKPSGRDSACKKCVSKSKKKRRLCKARSSCYIDQFTISLVGRPDEALFVERLKSLIEDILA